MTSRGKTLLNYALILGTLLAVLLIGLRNQEFDHAGDVLRAVSPISLRACLAGWAVFLLTDALTLKTCLSLHGQRITFRYALLVAVAGNYYSNVTPGASGGQPMQVYYMRKMGVPVGVGTSAVIVQFFSFQLILAVAGVVFWVVYREFIATELENGVWMLAVGSFVNLVGVVMAALMATHRGLVRTLGRVGVALGARLRLVKDPEGALAKWNEHTQTFHDSILFLIKRPASCLFVMSLAAVKLLALMLMPALVYRAMGLHEVHWVKMVAMGVMLHLTAAYIPLPGASGAQEGGFGLFFREIFPEGTLLVAMLLWRFFTYYMFLLVGAVALTVHTARGHKRDEGGPS